MRKILVVVACACSVLSAIPGRAELPVAAGFQSPESAQWDPATGAWYVSSKGGYDIDLSGRRGDGFISKVTVDGTVTPMWVTGLDSPFGFDFHDGKLYANDLDKVVVIDVGQDAGTIAGTIPIPDSGNALNDLTIDHERGHIYTGLTGRDTIYKIDIATGIPEIFVQGVIDAPNGLFVDGNRLLVGTFAIGGFTNSLLSVDLDTKEITTIATGFSAIDGLVKDGDGYLVTEFFTGRVLRVASDGTSTPVLVLPPSVADLGIDPERRVIGVPVTGTHAAYFWQLL